MKCNVNMVERYAESEVEERVKIIMQNYPNFIPFIEGYEKTLVIIIAQEKEYRRKQMHADLGVRVQTSGVSDPTARQAIDNVMIMDAIRNGDIDGISKDLDEEMRSMHEMEIKTLQNMRQDYEIFRDTFHVLDPSMADVFERYLKCGRKTEKLAYDLDMKPETLRSQVCRSKKTLDMEFASRLQRKYKYA